jgi:hypothetical protein
MKNLLLILVTISILSCTKKQDDPKPVVTTTQKQSNPVSNCNKDSSWTRTHSSIKGSLYTFKESCTTVTISFKLTGQTATVIKPTNSIDFVTNWKDLNAYRASTDPKKFYYQIRYSPWSKIMLYEVNEANSMGVSGSGMKIN